VVIRATESITMIRQIQPFMNEMTGFPVPFAQHEGANAPESPYFW
jgi:hypothetical protein